METCRFIHALMKLLSPRRMEPQADAVAQAGENPVMVRDSERTDMTRWQIAGAQAAGGASIDREAEMRRDREVPPA